jgi:hypothetical protein
VSDDPAKREGLDALAAAYLTLKGEAGIPLLEERFLTDFNADEDTAETNAVISALRFHGTEVDHVPRARIAQAVRLALKHPQLADTVIPDLARWEDWTVMEELVDLFKNCDDDYSYVRVPVVAYLHACPKPEAKQYLKELEAIDPDSIRRARFFMGEPLDDELDEGDESDPTSRDQGSADETSEPGSSPKDKASESGVHGTTPSAGTETNPDSTNGGGGTLSQMTVPVTHLAQDDHPANQRPSDNRRFDDAVDAAESEAQTLGPESASSKPARDAQIPTSEISTTTSSSVANFGRESNVTKLETVSQNVENLPVAVAATKNLVWLILFVPIGFSLVIFVLLWSVMNGWFERLIF